MIFIFIENWLLQCTILWKSVESTPQYYWYRSLNLFYNISQVFIYTLFSYCDTKIKIEISWKCTTKMNILLCHHCQHPGMFSLIYWSSLNCCSSLFLAQVITVTLNLLGSHRCNLHELVPFPGGKDKHKTFM